MSERLRRWVVVPLVGLLAPVLVVTTTSPAHAGGSASGILANSWIITDLAADAATTGYQMADLSSGERALATTATTGTVATTGLGAAPKAGGKLGMILNTVAVLGGLATLWPGGGSAPTLPLPSASGDASGSGSVGWTTWPGMVVTAPSGSSAAGRLLTFPGPVNVDVWSNIYNLNTGASQEVASWSRRLVGSNHSTSVTRNTQSGVPTKEIFCAVDAGAKTNSCPTASIVGVVWLPATAGTLASPTGTTETNPALVDRYIDSTANCKTPGGGFTAVTNRVGPFHFDPATASTLPEVPDVTCPAGTFLDSGTRVLHTNGTPTSADVAIVQPYDAPDWVEQQATTFPDCYPATSTMCVLEVVRTDPLPEVHCGEYVTGSANPCAGWWSDPKRSTRYECRFGETAVAMRRCKPYAQTFTNGTVAPSDPDPDADVDDPVSGADPTPESTPNLGECVPNWGLELLNPWWVFKAGACAISWAFMPSEGVLDDAGDGITDTINDSELANWRDAAVAGFTGALPSGAGGCAGPAVSWEGFTRVGLPAEWHPANACDEPVATAAQWSRIVLTAVIGVGGLFKILTMLMVSVGLSKQPDAVAFGTGAKS